MLTRAHPAQVLSPVRCGGKGRQLVWLRGDKQVPVTGDQVLVTWRSGSNATQAGLNMELSICTLLGIRLVLFLFRIQKVVDDFEDAADVLFGLGGECYFFGRNCSEHAGRKHLQTVQKGS